jgi:two-component system response regulator FixJ
MQDGRRPVIAVVDDDEAVRDSLRFLLQTAGFNVSSFASAQQFLAELTDEYTCLLVDQNMPQLTGLELLRRLRKRGCSLAVALMTGSPSLELSMRARELGAVTVMEKPLQEDVLLHFVSGAPV